MAADLPIGETRDVSTSATPGTPTVPPATSSLDPACPTTIPDHTLLQRIAGGSYGEVWLARSALGTWRAVKIVHRLSFDHDRPYEREFAGLQRYEPVSRSHDHLVDVLQVGRDDDAGYFYYVMELADDVGGMQKVECRMQNAECGMRNGVPITAAFCILPSAFSSYAPRTLSHDLRTHGRLPFEECVRIALALTSALGHLHRHGLVHRDVKPSNIVFVDGVPKLADVGLVAATSEARSFVGTPGYIPPEGPGTPQADVYGLGIVLYEIATGKSPHEFPEPGSLIETDPDRARWIELNAVIHRACQADVGRRYRSAEAMQADLALLREGRSVKARQMRERRWAAGRKTGGALVALAAMATLGWLGLRPGPAAAPGGEGTAVAPRAAVFVLPFRAEPQTYGYWRGDPLANRLTDALIDGLGATPGVRVGPRRSGWVIEDEGVLRERVRRDFGARQVVAGRVRTNTNSWEVTVALWDVGAASAWWSATFRGQTNALLELDRQIVQAVGQQLGLHFTATEQSAMEDVLSRNVEAWKLTRLAEARRSEVSRDGLTAAAQLAYQALALDPNYVDARMVLAFAYRNFSGVRPPREVWPQLRDLARQALEVDETAFGARYWLAWSRVCHDYDWEPGVHELEQVLPRDDHLNRAILYRWLGRVAAARVEQEQLERLNLVDSTVCFHSLKARFVERRYEEGIREAHRWIELLPASITPQMCLAQLAMESGDYTMAREAIQTLRRQDDSPEYIALDGRCRALMGQRDEAVRVVEQLEALSRTQYVNPYFVARIHAGLGDRAKALEALERAVGDRVEELVNADWGGLRTDPAWDDLGDDPRFQALLKQVGLDEWPK